MQGVRGGSRNEQMNKIKMNVNAMGQKQQPGSGTKFQSAFRSHQFPERLLTAEPAGEA